MKYIVKKIVPHSVRLLTRRALYPKSKEDLLRKGNSIVVTGKFPDGLEMDVRCYGVEFDEANNIEDNAAWAEAILYKNGYKVCHSEPKTEFLGRWELTYNENRYVFDIV